MFLKIETFNFVAALCKLRKNIFIGKILHIWVVGDFYDSEILIVLIIELYKIAKKTAFES